MAITLTSTAPPIRSMVEPETPPALGLARTAIGLNRHQIRPAASRPAEALHHSYRRPAGRARLPRRRALRGRSGKQVTTIEGLSKDKSHPVQVAWMEVGVPQCGYCQVRPESCRQPLSSPGAKDPTDRRDRWPPCPANLCRCGTYQRIRAGVHRAAKIANS